MERGGCYVGQEGEVFAVGKLSALRRATGNNATRLNGGGGEAV